MQILERVFGGLKTSQEAKVYRDHFSEWSAEKAGKYVLIHGDKFEFFDEEREAILASFSRYGSDAVLIEPISDTVGDCNHRIVCGAISSR